MVGNGERKSGKITKRKARKFWREEARVPGQWPSTLVWDNVSLNRESTRAACTCPLAVQEEAPDLAPETHRVDSQRSETWSLRCGAHSDSEGSFSLWTGGGPAR